MEMPNNMSWFQFFRTQRVPHQPGFELLPLLTVVRYLFVSAQSFPGLSTGIKRIKKKTDVKFENKLAFRKAENINAAL